MMGKKIGFAANINVVKEAEEKEKKPKREPDPLSYELLDSFCRKYIPAEKIEHATNQFTTEEITSAISKFNGDNYISNNHIKNIMLQKGYKYIVEIECFKLVFKWIVIERL